MIATAESQLPDQTLAPGKSVVEKLEEEIRLVGKVNAFQLPAGSLHLATVTSRQDAVALTRF
jgi:hypothetical protein